MKRPKIEDYREVDSDQRFTWFSFEIAQDKYIDELKKEIQHLENELGIRESFLDK